MWTSSRVNPLCTPANEEQSDTFVDTAPLAGYCPRPSTTTTSQRPLKFSSRSPPATPSPRTCTTRISVTTPSAQRSLHHCSLRSEKTQPDRRHAYHSLEESLSSSQSSSVGHGTGRPVEGNQFDSLPNVRENSRRSSENEQIRILLERQKEQILAD